VPALGSETTFARAQELLQQNKRFAPRRTLEPTPLQGMLVCRQCGYALYRTSTRTSQRTLYYYRCLGSDRYRHLKGPVCTNRPVRQDALDQLVWTEVLRLLDDPALIEAEIARRRAVARTTDPLRVRTDELQREQARLDKSSERLLSAYQEGLMSLAQLRQRMPELQQRARAVAAEIHALELAAVDEARYLQLAETLAGFRAKLRARAETLDVRERQQVLRLIVKEVLVDRDTITLRHSIPIPPADAGAHGLPPTSAGPPAAAPNPDYLLRSGRQDTPLRGPAASPFAASRLLLPIVPLDHPRGAEPLREEPEDVPVRHAARHRRQEWGMRNRVEVGREVGVEHLRVALRERAGDLRHGLVRVLLRPEAVGARLEVRLEDRLQDQDGGRLDYSVPHGGDAEGPLPALPLGDHYTPDGIGSVGVRPEFLGQTREERTDPVRLDGGDGDAIHSGGAPVRAHQGPGVTQEVRPVDLVVEEVKPEGGLRLGLAVELPLEGAHCLWRFKPHSNPPRVPPWEAWREHGPFPPRRLCCPSGAGGTVGRSDCLGSPAATSAVALYAPVGLLWATGQALPWCPLKLSPHAIPATPEGLR
jgi:hypothetical protein